MLDKTKDLRLSLYTSLRYGSAHGEDRAVCKLTTVMNFIERVEMHYKHEMGVTEKDVACAIRTIRSKAGISVPFISVH